jgi:hypothetical protein
VVDATSLLRTFMLSSPCLLHPRSSLCHATACRDRSGCIRSQSTSDSILAAAHSSMSAASHSAATMRTRRQRAAELQRPCQAADSDAAHDLHEIRPAATLVVLTSVPGCCGLAKGAQVCVTSLTHLSRMSRRTTDARHIRRRLLITTRQASWRGPSTVIQIRRLRPDGAGRHYATAADCAIAGRCPVFARNYTP